VSTVHVERRERVAVVTIDDPDRRNAFTLPMCAEIGRAFDALEADDGVGAVVVTGAPPAFCAGADLSQLGASRRDGLLAIYEGFLRVARSPLPTVAAVNGAAVGAGMNLALACDVRLAARSARFDTRFLDLGIHPGGGHTWMFRRATDLQTTMAAVVFGQVLDGPDAERVGLAWRCLDDGELLDAAVGLAERAAAMPPELSRIAKATVIGMDDATTHAEAVERELVEQVASMDRPAFAERLTALRSRISTTDGD
jgi:enoyl-CoA hydratase